MLSFFKTFRSLGPLAISLAGALTLSLESYLKLQGKSLCSTTACAVVGTSIRFGEPLLIGGGAVFFWLFTAVYFFSRRYPQYLQHLPTVLLLSALAFDGALIGFQFFALDQRCLLCLSVATLLIILALSQAIAQRSFILFFGALGIWLGSFIALGILKMPLPASAYSNMSFYEYKPQTNSSGSLSVDVPDTYTLIMSLHCSHCQEVIAYLSDHPPITNKFRFATIDQDQDSLKKISRFTKEVLHQENQFAFFKNIENAPIPLNQAISKGLMEKANYAQQFLINLDITGVPVLLAETKTEKKLLIGTDSIIDFLQKFVKTR